MQELVSIPGYLRYYASRDGTIYNCTKQLTPHLQNGYAVIKLIPDSKKKSRNERVHRLIALTFIGSSPSPIHQVNHKDGNKLNNKASNLEWVSPSENMRHYFSSNGQPPSSPLLFEEPNGKCHYYRTMKQAAQELGVALSTIWSATFEGKYKGCKLTRL